MGDRALGLEADKCSSGKESWPLQTWEVPGLSSCVKIAGADSWESGLWGSSSCSSQRSWCGGSPSECGALECADTSRLAPPRAPGVSEPFHKHLPWLSAQTECFRSVKRGQRERSSCGLPSGISVAQRSVESHGTLCTHHSVVSSLLLQCTRVWSGRLRFQPHSSIG